jgi:hypothetical protein
MKRFIVLLFIHFSITLLFSQSGDKVYQFLELPTSSYVAALGGANISPANNDINFAFQNPATLSGRHHQQIGLNYSDYLADIGFGSVMYSHKASEKDFLAVGIQYVDYGNFVYTTEDNVTLGTFSAKDIALNLVYSRHLSENWQIGATLKPIASFMEEYQSYAIACDVGTSFYYPDIELSGGLVVKNIGTQIKGYYSENNSQHTENLPFSIQLGISKKLAHAPFRFSLTAHNLQKWDLSYASSNSTSVSFVDMLFRHTIIGVEFIPSNNFYIALGYNHRRAADLGLSQVKSLAGFSAGIGLKVYKFNVGFSITQYQIGILSSQFSITTALSSFNTK